MVSHCDTEVKWCNNCGGYQIFKSGICLGCLARAGAYHLSEKVTPGYIERFREAEGLELKPP